ncbi:hypothetical protein HY449_00005 [Candidatus Pacearchaeota archaeon]|nr:hypothetical protein [Candidatus Pacearchaeota archaeon]
MTDDIQGRVEGIVLNLIIPRVASERSIREELSHMGKSFPDYKDEMVDSALRNWETRGYIEPLYPKGVSPESATPDNTYWHNKR